LRDGLQLGLTSREIAELATRVPDAGGLVIVPAFVGLGAPYWDPHARGAVFGITRGTTAAHLARAAIESMAFQTQELLAAMEDDSGVRLAQLKVDGGASVNDELMQLQADLLNVTVRRPVVAETTALGAAYLAGLAVAFWSSTDEVKRNWALDREFTPAMSVEERTKRCRRWKRAVERTLEWERD
jgi:glycerol kinase